VTQLTSAQLLLMTKKLQVLSNSGIPITQCLDLVAEQSPKGLDVILQDVKDRVSQGASLWESFAIYPSVFPKFYVAVIRAGELTGDLGGVLLRLCAYLSESDRLHRAVRCGVIDPLIGLVIGFTVAVSIFFQFSSQRALPVFLTCLVLIYLTQRYFRSVEGRSVVADMLFNLPILRELSKKVAVATFARTFRVLSASGVPVVESIDICKQTLGNAVLQSAMVKIRREVDAGSTLGAAMSRLTIFPKMASRMVSAGESTGSLDQMLESVASLYESDVERLLTISRKVTDPVLMIALSACVGGAVAVVILSLFRIV
jgi:type IV pilus assembly protein PilC